MPLPPVTTTDNDCSPISSLLEYRGSARGLGNGRTVGVSVVDVFLYRTGPRRGNGHALGLHQQLATGARNHQPLLLPYQSRAGQSHLALLILAVGRILSCNFVIGNETLKFKELIQIQMRR
jgi:hypothetical protein